MPEKSSVEKEISSGEADVSSEYLRDEVSLWCRQAAEPVRADEGRKAQIARAAHRLRKPYGVIKRLWYGEYRTIPAGLYLSIKTRMDAIEAAQLRLAKHEIAIREARIAARKRTTDADFFDLAE